MPYLSDYKAILFDVDRTLIPPNREIFPEVLEILKKLHDTGVLTGLCSGRGYASLVNVFMPIFPNNAVHILAGGSLVISNTGTVLWQQTIEPTIIDELKNLINETHSSAIFMKPDAQYAKGEILAAIHKHPWNPIGKDLDTMTPDGVGLVYIAKPSDQITAYLLNHPKLSFKDMLSNQGYQYYDITAKGVTKALAMEEWSKATNIALSKTIGFGDSINDFEFLQNCGFAVAMGNADYEIKAIADRVIGQVSQKGLPNYVQTILEGNPL
ncbi:MAG: pyridoxal phosphatase [Patescibacteria group bacterium]|nr:MAG: pyridoxal phosphatase [Patescibacteria group bacterium]